MNWQFRGFWKGDGEIRIEEFLGGVVVEGHERLAVRWLWFLSPFVERHFMRRAIPPVWQLGWERLRKHEPASEHEKDGRDVRP